MEADEKKNDVPKVVSSKKTLYIVLAVVAGLFFICLATIIVVVAFVLPKPNPGPSVEICEKSGLFYDIKLDKCVSSLTVTPTETVTVTPTETIMPEENEEIYVSKQVSIKFKDKPLKAESVSLFVNDYISNDDGVQDVYLIGEFANGEITNVPTAEKLDLKGKPLYLAIMQKQPEGDLRGAWISHVHFVKIDNTYFILDAYYEYYSPGVNSGVNKKFATLDFNEFVTPEGFYEKEVPDYNEFIKSVNGIYYSRYHEYWPTLFNSNDLTAVDTLMGSTVYLSKSDEYSRTFVKAKDGFLYNVKSIPTIMIKDGAHYLDSKAEINWNNGGVNVSSYAYSSIGSCMENDLEVIKNPPALKKTGVAANGSDIFEAISSQDSYRKSLYEEDYLQREAYKYNFITTDDVVPLTYEQYLNYHPVFYWQDEYGRYVTFVNNDFVFSGGCGKPVVYLYPTQTIDATVKVIPNGRLTLTVPAIGKDNTWTVLATKDSQITDKESGKKYSYLWWESQGAVGVHLPKEGFVLAKDSLEKDLRSLLTKMNMTSNEIAAFCEYWMPIMNEDITPYYLVTFLFDEQVDQIAQLEFAPIPDVVNRVFMVYEPIEKAVDVKPLAISPFERSGYYVVEWGGAKK